MKSFFSESKWLGLVYKALPFLLPLAIWLFLFRDMFSGQAFFCGDSFATYAAVKVFIENLEQGVFLLWNPFLDWGHPSLITSVLFGVFNPIWLLMLILHRSGLSYYLAFVYTGFTYLFIGMLGFYFFAKTFFRDERAAYLSFLIMLFSFSYVFQGLINTIIIYVPMIWFFYFGLRFCQSQEPKAFVGLIFTLMIVATSYFPPYLLTICFFLIFAAAISDFSGLCGTVLALASFARKRFFLVLFCSFSLAMALLPPFRAFQMSQNKEVVFIDRHRSQKDIWLERGAEMKPSEIVFSSCNLRKLPKELLSSLNLRGWRYEHPFVPVFVFLISLLGAFNRMTRKSFLLFILLILLFFILLGPPGGLYLLFYRFLPFFSVIHSVSCFWMVLIGVGILFSVLQWQRIVQEQFLTSRIAKFFILLLTHGSFFAFLVWQRNNLVSSYITIVMSFFYFYVLFFLKEKKFVQKLLFPFLIVCAVIQPIEALWHYTKDPFNNREYIQNYILVESQGVRFAYVRPDPEGPPTDDNYHKYRLQQKDYLRFFGLIDHPCRWAGQFFSYIPQEIAEKYVKNKFYLYDHVAMISEPLVDNLVLPRKVFQENLNLAFIEDDLKDPAIQKMVLRDSQLESIGQATIKKVKSEELVVTDFNVNAIKIKTNFKEEKFLVYTDSYHQDWKLFVNGRQEKLYRANIAFKGIFLPAGENTLYLVYSPLGGVAFFFFVFYLCLGMFLWTIFLFLKDFIMERTKRHKGCDEN